MVPIVTRLLFRSIGKILFYTDRVCLILRREFRFPEIRGEERTRSVARVEEEEARKRKKKKKKGKGKGKEKASGKIEKQEGRCKGTEKARDKGEADTQDAYERAHARGYTRVCG